MGTLSPVARDVKHLGVIRDQPGELAEVPVDSRDEIPDLWAEVGHQLPMIGRLMPVDSCAL